MDIYIILALVPYLVGMVAAIAFHMSGRKSATFPKIAGVLVLVFCVIFVVTLVMDYDWFSTTAVYLNISLCAIIGIGLIAIRAKPTVGSEPAGTTAQGAKPSTTAQKTSSPSQTMEVVCPQCDASIKVIPGPPPIHIKCPSCGVEGELE